MGIKKHKIAVVFIGDSITEGVLLDSPVVQAPPARAIDYLKRQPDIDIAGFSNEGHGGATTFDFLPGSGYYEHLINAAGNFTRDKTSLLIFSIMLGANDSAIRGTHGAPVSPDTYMQNLKNIIDHLLEKFPDSKIIIHHPLWYSPNTYNSAMYLQAGLDREEQYAPQIEQLVKYYRKMQPGKVIDGDKNGFAYFEKHYKADMHPQQGHKGIFYLHPNKNGAFVLGTLWGEAIYQYILGAH